MPTRSSIATARPLTYSAVFFSRPPMRHSRSPSRDEERAFSKEFSLLGGWGFFCPSLSWSSPSLLLHPPQRVVAGGWSCSRWTSLSGGGGRCMSIRFVHQPAEQSASQPQAPKACLSHDVSGVDYQPSEHRDTPSIYRTISSRPVSLCRFLLSSSNF